VENLKKNNNTGQPTFVIEQRQFGTERKAPFLLFAHKTAIQYGANENNHLPRRKSGQFSSPRLLGTTTRSAAKSASVVQTRATIETQLGQIWPVFLDHNSQTN